MKTKTYEGTMTLIYEDGSTEAKRPLTIDVDESESLTMKKLTIKGKFIKHGDPLCPDYKGITGFGTPHNKPVYNVRFDLTERV